MTLNDAKSAVAEYDKAMKTIAVGDETAYLLLDAEISASRACIAHVRSQPDGVDEAMVERLAKHLCRVEWSGKGLSLDDMAWRLNQWPRYKDEARAALLAALGETK